MIDQDSHTLKRIVNKDDGRQRKDVKSLEKEIDSLIWETVCERKCQETPLLKKDLLQMILEEAMDHFTSKEASRHFIVDRGGCSPWEWGERTPLKT
ncbi:hypothetical protein OSB04_017571 [Centaurea solstitialis]|uniref:Uncharacterized protein n=1 Tax=Centaurea solstitialis TaxID=347529 RepID=A0AA38TE40_9ASTR|nr:hypothetical protein OSB04_017571 [Centaurea solstitialis]